MVLCLGNSDGNLNTLLDFKIENLIMGKMRENVEQRK